MAAGFYRVGGKDSETKKRIISSLTLSVGDLLMASRSAGTVVEATSSVTVSLLQGGGIVAKAATSSDTEVLINDIVYGAVYIAEVTATANASHNYMRFTLTDKNTVNNTGTDDSTNGIFMQTGVIDSTHIKGEFIRALT
jgi:adenine-specific DNA methylase